MGQEKTGKLVTLLKATVITADGTVASTPVTGLDGYSSALFLLTVSSKTMDSLTTLNIWVQYSPDRGTTWDDLVSFSQLTNAAVGDGTYVTWLLPGASAADRVTRDGSLTANSVVSANWCDRLRVKYTSANFSGTDEVTIKVQVYLS